MTKQFVFLNGRFLPLKKARVSVMDRGFHYGDGVFETILATNGEPEALAKHLARLHQGARVLQIAIPYSDHQIHSAIQKLLQKNHLKNALVKIMVTRGEASSIGLSPKLAKGRPTFCIFAWKVDLHDRNKQRYKVVICRIPRNRTPISGLKSLNYLSHVIAKAEVDGAGADEAIFVDDNDRVLEGTISNIFMVKNGKLITPPLQLGILDGITRRQVLQTARRLKIPTHERPFTVRELLNADEAFLSFTSAGIVPIQSVGRRKIGERCPGKVTRTLKE